MTKATRAVTYTLNARTSGVSGLERFQASLKRILDVQQEIKRQGDVLTHLRDKTVSIRVKFEQAQLDAALRGLNRTINISVRLARFDDVRNDINTLKTLLGSLGSNMQYRVTVNTTALNAVYTQINTQITQLQSLITQLRSLGRGGGGGGGGGGTGGGTGGGLSADTQRNLREIERLNNLWTRGKISAANYEAALTGIQARLQTAASAATRGTAEFARIDQGITRITQSLRGINTDNFAKIRTDAAAIRLAFDQATAGVSRNSTEFRAAAATYASGTATITARLIALRDGGALTVQQLGQVNRELQRLTREANTIGGGVNHAGLSGNIANVAGMMGGQMGMVVTQGMAAAAMFKSIQATAGPAGLAMLGVGGAAIAAGGGLIALGTTGMAETKKLQTALNILQANGVQDLGAIEGKVKALQTNLELVGQSFSRGDLMLSMADIVKAGVSADDALTLLASSTRLAAAEQINLNDASGLLLKNIRQYQGDVSDAARVGDMLATAGNLAAGTANDLSVGLGIVAGTGFQAKVEMYDLLGMLVELDNKGMSAADVGANGLRAALAALADITKKGQGVLKELGIEFNDASGKARPAGDIMIELGEKMRGMGIVVDKTTGTLSGNGEALRTVSSLMDNRAAAAVINLTGEWKAYGTKVKDSEGALVSYSNTMQQGLQPALDRVKNSFSEAGGAFVRTFADPLADFLTGTLTPLIKDLGTLFEKLAGMKEQGQIKLSVLFAPGDSTSAKVLSLIAAPVTLGAALVQPANVESLRLALQRGGILPATNNPVTAAQQFADVAKNYAAYLKQAQEADATYRAGRSNPTGPLAPTVPEATTGVSGLAAVANMGLGNSRRGTPYGGTYFGGLRHNGEDFFAPTGTALQAGFTGMLTTRWSETTGRVLELVDAQGQKLLLGHLQGFKDSLKGLPEEIQAAFRASGGAAIQVTKGQTIGYVGQTGSLAHKDLGSGNAHVHVMSYDARGTERDPLTTMYQPFLGRVTPTPITAPSPTGGTSTYTGLTAAQIAQAQALNAAIDKAQKALNAKPNDVGLIKALDNAKQAADAWGDKSESNARALTAVAAAQSTLKKESGEYVATVKDLNAYGSKALQLIKDQEAAQKSGNAARILAADNALKAWQTDTKASEQTRKARAAVVEVERAAYQSRQQAAQDADRKGDQQAKEAERREREQAQLRSQIADEQRQMTIQQADAALNRTKVLATAELATFKGTSAQRLALVERQARDEEAARVRVAAATRAKALADARNGQAQLRAGREGAANTAYNQAVLEASTDRDEAIRQAKEKEAAAVRDLRGEYSQLADSIREQGVAGTFDAEAKQKAVKAFNALGRAAAEAGLSTDQYITGARRSVWALVQGAEAATERLNQLDLGGAIIDPKTGQLLYKTDEQVRGIGVAAEDAADDYYDLGEAISNVGLFSKTELTDLVAKSGLAADEAERLLAAWDALYGEMDSGPLALDNLQGRGANNPSSDDPATGALIEGEAEQLAAAFWKSSGEQLQGVLDGLKNQDSPLAELLGGSIAAKDLISRIELETDPAQLQGLAQEVADFLDSSVGKRLPPTVRDALTAAVQGATDYQETLAQATGDAVVDGFDRAGKADPAPTNKFAGYMQTLIGDSIDLADPEQLRGVTEELDRARAAGELTAQEFRLLHLLIDSINGSGGLDIPVNVDDQRLEQYNQQLTDLEARYRAGEISGEEFAAEAKRLIPLLERMAEAAAAAGNVDLARVYRAAAGGLREMTKEVKLSADSLKGYISQARSILGQFSDSGENALTVVADWMTMNMTAYQQWMSGDMVGAIMTTIQGIMNIGESIANLNPKLREWKKMQVELAAEQRQAAGSKRLNGWLDNPYYADLNADAQAREKLANSKWYQRAWWSITGSGPNTMSDDLAKLKIKAAEIFSQFGGDLANTFEESLMEGFDLGDFSKVNDKLDGMINKFVARMTIQMVLANSKLKDLIKAYADARAAGGDGTAELAAIRQEVQAVTGIAQGALSGLDGFGAGADPSSAAASASNPITGANFYVANSSKIDLLDTAVTRFDALTLRHGTSMDRHSVSMDRLSDMIDRLTRDGITLTDSTGTYRGAFR